MKGLFLIFLKKKTIDICMRVCYNGNGALLSSRGRGAGYNMMTNFCDK